MSVKERKAREKAMVPGKGAGSSRQRSRAGSGTGAGVWTVEREVSEECDTLYHTTSEHSTPADTGTPLNPVPVPSHITAHSPNNILPTPTEKNHKRSIEHSSEISALIEKERSLDDMLGPFSTPSIDSKTLIGKTVYDLCIHILTDNIATAQVLNPVMAACSREMFVSTWGIELDFQHTLGKLLILADALSRRGLCQHMIDLSDELVRRQAWSPRNIGFA